MNKIIKELCEQVFRDFYEHPFIKEIEPNEKWTISDNKKRPINIKAVLNEGKIFGADITAEENPCVSLTQLKNHFPAMTNTAYYLNALEDGFIVLDIEPKCPDDIKLKLMQSDYIYGELSMSKKGLHLIYRLPPELKKYPHVQRITAIKEEHGYYEILLNHWVTFTRWSIFTPQTPDKDLFPKVFNSLAEKTEQKKAAETQRRIEFKAEFENIPEIQDFDEILRLTTQYEYGKTPKDFEDDISKYEYGYIGWLYYQLNNVLHLPKYQNYNYSYQQKLIILYHASKKMIPYRAKHESIRSDMPWLMYLSYQIISRSGDMRKEKNQ